MRTRTLPSCRARGFTLIELLVVVVLVGILAAVAYPSFRDHVRRTARAEGRAALLEAAALQEQFFLDNKSYSGTLADLGAPTVSETGKYALAVDAESTGCPLTRCYVLRATPEGPQAGDSDCAALTLSSAGSKSATGTVPADCW
jgi:type IV pilus assembly protein PilE